MVVASGGKADEFQIHLASTQGLNHHVEAQVAALVHHPRANLHGEVHISQLKLHPVQYFLQCRTCRGEDTYSLCDGEHLPTSGVDWDESRRQQLPALAAVGFGGVKQLIHTNLDGTEGMEPTLEASMGENAWILGGGGGVFVQGVTYLAEVVPVERGCRLRSQLEKMQLCS